MGTTIVDIAKMAGCSTATVSRVLNSSGRVSDKSRAKVMDAIKKTGFKLNTNAKNLKVKENNSIAIIVKGYNNLFFAPMIEQLQRLLHKHGMETSIVFCDEFSNEGYTAETVIGEYKPRGIIMLGGYDNSYLGGIQSTSIPIIMLANDASCFKMSNISSFVTDDKAAGKYAIQKLIDLGHKKICILGGFKDLSAPTLARYTGAMEAFKENNLEFDESLQYVESRYAIKSGYDAMKVLLRSNPDMTAVFAFSDAMAIGALKCLRDEKKRVPDDISIIGFDGIELSKYTNPTLTTIRQDTMSMASNGVQHLIDELENGIKPVYVKMAYQFEEGQSIKDISR